MADNADILIGLYGLNIDQFLMVQSQTEAGDQILKQMDLATTDEPRGRQDAINALITQRTKYRDDMFAKTHEATDSLEKMSAYFATCVNCYNCRVACPVCYCKECVFVTDVFNHDPSQYLQWANRKGIIKMPTDTLFSVPMPARMIFRLWSCFERSPTTPRKPLTMRQAKASSKNHRFRYFVRMSFPRLWA